MTRPPRAFGNCTPHARSINVLNLDSYIGIELLTAGIKLLTMCATRPVSAVFMTTLEDPPCHEDQSQKAKNNLHDQPELRSRNQ
jgi:hypothetical protein